ncbi:MAG: RnfABCDGE type electron transport complex subunit D [Planctomycetes bacterium]|nr:RnfABCDGE type electron transport complex subunit D [Planctomycetota bacterium]
MSAQAEPIAPKPAAAAKTEPAPPTLVVGHWPHLRGKDSIARIMWSVAACLVPAALASGWFFGIRAYMHIGLAAATAVVTEAAIQRLRKVPVTVSDGSAVVTGILTAFCLPAQAGWYVPVVASLVAVAIAKQCFGGLGANVWNPALIGRAFVHVAYPVDLNPSSYPVLTSGHVTANLGTAGDALPAGVQAITGASPLAQMKAACHAVTGATPGANQLKAGVEAAAADIQAALAQAVQQAQDQIHAGLTGGLPHLGDMLMGSRGGSIGETSALLLALGAVYLIAKGWVRWQIPAAYFGAVILGALALPIHLAAEVTQGTAVVASRDQYLWAAAWMPELAWKYVAYHVLSGGLVLGALYMATDMVTSPLTGRGMLIFGAGCGVLTILIRLYGGYPEAVCYSILLMNTTVALIDRYTLPRIFGHEK